jgi:RNA-binding protein YhbY
MDGVLAVLTGIVVAHEVIKVKIWGHLRETKLLVVGCAWQTVSIFG